MKRLFYGLMVKKALVLLLMAAMLWHQQVSYSQALPVVPVANFVMNRAVAGVITRVAAARGFAANDARIAATLSGVGQVSTGLNVASAVVGVGMAVAGAPVWMGIAAGLGVIALGMGINAMVNGQQASISVASTSTGNQLQVNSPSTPMPMYTMPPLVDTTPVWAQAASQGAPIYRDPMNCYSNEACYALPLVPDVPSYRYSADSAGKTVLVTNDLNVFGQWYTFLTKPTMTVPAGVTFSWTFADAQLNTNAMGGNTITVNISESRSGGDDQGLPSYSRIDTFNNVGSIYGDLGPQYYPDLNTAYPSLPASLKSAQVSPDTLARIVDAQWQQAAAQPGYQGLPYSVTQPVTSADVQPWAMENPMAVPTVGDLLTPASNPGTNTVPISTTVQPGTSSPTPTDPGTNPSPTPGSNVNVVNTPNVNVINKINVDLGADPGISSPTMENTPTASMILQPLFDLFPSLRNFVVPSHGSECPKPTFELFGKSIVMESHCTLTESVKPTLYAVMAAAWLLIGLFIVLAA